MSPNGVIFINDNLYLTTIMIEIRKMFSKFMFMKMDVGKVEIPLFPDFPASGIFFRIEKIRLT